eukprot:10438391-Prorocentrum_lima.AAC.1
MVNATTIERRTASRTPRRGMQTGRRSEPADGEPVDRSSRYGLRAQRVGEAAHPGPSVGDPGSSTWSQNGEEA